MVSTGQYDEGTMTGLDFVMDEASKRGIRITLVFANYWSQYGGVDQYNVWSFQAGTGQLPLIAAVVLASEVVFALTAPAELH